MGSCHCPKNLCVKWSYSEALLSKGWLWEPEVDTWFLVAVSEGRWDLQWIHSISTRSGDAQDPRLRRWEHREGFTGIATELDQTPHLSSPTQGAPAARPGTQPLSPAVTAATVTSLLAPQAAGLLQSPGSAGSRACPDPCPNASSAHHGAPLQRQQP